MPRTRPRSIRSSCILATLLSIELLLGDQLLRPRIQAQETPLIKSSLATALLPLVTKGFPAPPPQFGVQMMKSIDEDHGLSEASEVGIHWVRYHAFPWDRIEPVLNTPPKYNWAAVDGTSLRIAYQNGWSALAIVQYAPDWAQKVPGSACGPIHADQWDEYARFLSALVKRYKDPPYGIKYWELGNEPDAPVGNGRSIFGCWGDREDPYYGGEYYGQMLRHAYPAIKAADPQAQVLVGGLLLDCDPAHAPPGQDCTPSRFLEGILRVGGGDYFDIVSFHGYALYDGSLGQDEQHRSWGARGGVVLGKADYLRELMDKYGVDKPLMHTEGSLICPGEDIIRCNPPETVFYDKQADYVVWLYVRNWADGILATTWFQFDGPGWRYSGMLDASQTPKPAYQAFRFLTQQLGNAWYEGPVPRYAPLKGYAFGTPDKRIWVLWPADETPWSIYLPHDVTHVYDKYGNDITPKDNTITFSHPIYVERPR